MSAVFTNEEQAYWSAYQSLGEKHKDAIVWKTSALEKHGQAMFLT